MVGEPEIIAAQLKKVLRNKLGAHSSVLYQHAPELVDLLCPPEAMPNVSVRVLVAEQMIKRGCEALDGPTGRALEVLCAFAPGTSWTTLDQRRTRAGNLLSEHPIQADTLRRDHNEKPLLFALAFELFKLIISGVHVQILNEMNALPTEVNPDNPAA